MVDTNSPSHISLSDDFHEEFVHFYLKQVLKLDIGRGLFQTCMIYTINDPARQENRFPLQKIQPTWATEVFQHMLITLYPIGELLRLLDKFSQKAGSK